MIVPMQKISLIVLDSEKESALKTLRKLGVMHINYQEAEGARLDELNAEQKLLQRAELTLADLAKAKKRQCGSESESSYEDALSAAEEIENLLDNKKSALETIARCSKEIERLSPWGEVNPADFDELAQKGVYLFPFEMSVADYLNLPQSVKVIPLSRDKKVMRVVVWGEDDLLHADMPNGARELVMPEISSAQLIERRQAAEREIICDDARLETYIDRLADIRRALKIAEEKINFERVRLSMNVDAEYERYAIAWIEGYAPEPSLEAVLQTARANRWGCLADEPAEEDTPPTQLKNNKFVSLIYPVSDFLGTVPGYREYDISGWFLLFFCIFFGMIFGDGGYGLLMVLVALGAITSSLLKKKSPGAGINLLLLLGLTTMVWGAVTCTWFGLTPDVLPAWIQRLSIPAISNVTSAQSPEMESFVKQNLQVFCFSLALAQLSVAHIKGIVRYIKSARFLGELGSLLMLWGMFNVVLSMVVDGVRFPIRTAAIGLIAVGFVLNFVFSNYEGKLGASILESCKNIVSVLLGVVNVFSDIVSYIRLWAVGLAGAAISATINEMAGPMLGGALLFFGVLLLAFGHGLNLILNLLSVIVHGVRLNTLEFSNHLGMTWSGIAYKPFRETVND